MHIIVVELTAMPVGTVAKIHRENLKHLAAAEAGTWVAKRFEIEIKLRIFNCLGVTG